MNTLSQLAIAVEDISKAKSFFEMLTGKELSKTHNVESQKVNVAFLDMGDTKIELLEPAAEQTPVTKFLQQRGGGIHHMGIMTDRFDELIEELRSAGIRTLGEPSPGAEGHRVLFLHPKDTFGVLIELEERPSV